MRALPILKELPRVPLQDAEPREVDPSCELCVLHARHAAGARCIGALGEPGGLLVVDSFPDRAAMGARRPFAGQASAAFLQLVRSKWTGPLALDSALRCSPGGDASVQSLVKPIVACRGYLAQTIEEVRPTRILATGAHAIFSLTGRRLPPFEVRKGFTWLYLDSGPVPVFYAPAPLAGARNRFVRQWLEEDVAWALTATPPATYQTLDTGWAYLVESAADAEHALAVARAARWASVDLEWAGRPFDRDHRMLSLSLTPAPLILPSGAPELNDTATEIAFVWPRTSLENEATLAPLRRYLADPSAKKVGTYIKSDTAAILAAWKVWLRGVVFDARLARKLMDVEASGELEDMAELVGRGGHKAELEHALNEAVAALRRAAKKNGGLVPRIGLPPNLSSDHAQKLVDGGPKLKKRWGFAAVEPDLLYRYNGGDTTVTAKLAAHLEHQLSRRSPGMQHVWQSLTLPAGNAFARIEAWGIKADRDAIRAFGDYLSLRLAELRPQLGAHAGPDFDPGNRLHVSRLLYDELKLPVLSETATGQPSTEGTTLEKLSHRHPVVPLILRARQLAKMKSTYADGSDEEEDGGLLVHVRDDGRIHPTIHPDGARTGRTSSSAPNFQNMPSMETDDPEAARLAKMLRDCFVAEDGWALFEGDYSQIELRVAADESGDQKMIEVFRSGQDYHMRTAQMLSRELWGIAPEAVTKGHRREVKPVNFALLYDDDPYGIAFRIGCDVRRATRIRDAVFGVFPDLARFIKERVRAANAKGISWTWWDGFEPARERSLWRIADYDEAAAKTARRGAWNGPVQGKANDYLVSSAIDIVDWFVGDGLPARVGATIHDSVFGEVRLDYVEEVLSGVRSIMQNKPTRNGVPLVADFKVGRSWGSMVEYKGGPL